MIGQEAKTKCQGAKHWQMLRNIVAEYKNTHGITSKDIAMLRQLPTNFATIEEVLP